MAQQRLRKLVAGLSGLRPWIDNIEVYLGLCWTKQHNDTSLLLFTVFPYHGLSKNACYVYEVHKHSSVYKVRN